MKKCPFCAEEIQEEAIKCKHCGEMLTMSSATPSDSPPSSSHLTGQRTSGSRSEMVGTVMVIIPIIVAMLTWFWVASMSLIQHPASVLNFLFIAMILATACLGAFEANSVNMGNDSEVAEWKKNGGKGLKPPTPLVWFFFISCLWIVGYPAYLLLRRKHGFKSLLGAGIFVAVVCTASYVMVDAAIHSAQVSAGEAIERLPQ